MPESALAARLTALEKRLDKWDADWEKKHEPKLERADDFRVWLIGIAAGIGFVAGLVTLKIITVAVNI